MRRKKLGVRLLALAALTTLSVSAQLEDRTPTGGSNITTRKCIGGTNAGDRCKQNSECNSNNCAPFNTVDLTVNLRTATGGGWTPTAGQMTAIRNNFTTINNTIADNTDGQMVLGTVALIVNNGAPNAVVQLSAGMCSIGGGVCTQDADCASGTCGLGGGSTNTGGWGSNGQITVGIGCIQNPLCFAHEFMHLIANVRDEYEGALDDGVDNDADGQIDECNENQSGNRCFGGANNGQPCTADANCPGGGACRRIVCIDPGTAAVPGCLMRCCLGNTGDELCHAANHDADVDTEQSQCRNNNSCWTQFGIEWPSVMLVPAGAPDPGPAVAPAPVGFIEPAILDRFVAVIDRSGSMANESPTRLDVAKTTAKDFIDLLTAGTQFGLASFSNAATKDFPGAAGLQTLTTAGDRTNAKNAVDGLSTGGDTNIGAGLRQALSMFTEAGGSVTLNSTVLLLTDGINNQPPPDPQADLDAALAELAAASLPVFVTCIGAGRDSVQCSNIADQTAGRFVDSAETENLYDAFVEFVALAERQGISTAQIGTPIGHLETSSRINARVEPGTASARFVMSWTRPDSNLDLRLFQPDGAQVPLSERIIGSQGEFYRIANPAAGVWQMEVHAANVPSPPEKFSARAILDHDELTAEAGLAKSTIAWPAAFHISAHPALGRSIEGCQVSALIQKPDGSSETVELTDDGKNGDAEDGDGLYSRDFRNFTGGSGIHTFIVSVRCAEGVASVHGHEDPGVGEFPFTPLVPTFDRVIRFSGIVTGVPANLPPVAAICRDERRECTGVRTSVPLDGTCSTDPENEALTYSWSSTPAATFNPNNTNSAFHTVGEFLLGRNQIGLTVTDPAGASSAPATGLVVIADTTPPNIVDLIANPSSLWPPNHNMAAVTVTPKIVEACDPNPVCKITNVASNEPVDGLGDGDTAPDWQITSSLGLNLRSERSGQGNGRRYVVTVSCSDQSGNVSSKDVAVTVAQSSKP